METRKIIKTLYTLILIGMAVTAFLLIFDDPAGEEGQFYIRKIQGGALLGFMAWFCTLRKKILLRSE